MGECLILRSGGVDTSDATATNAQILTGYTAYVNDVLITGTMMNRGAVTQTLNPGGSYAIPAGYHNGNGKVTAVALSDQTSGTAAVGDILKDKTAWVNGVQLTGTMANNGTVNQSLAANGSYTIPVGYHSGSGKVSQSLTTQAAATITPGTSAKTAVAAGRWTTGAVTVAGASTLIASNIKSEVTIFGVTGTATTLPKIEGEAIQAYASDPCGLYLCPNDSEYTLDDYYYRICLNIGTAEIDPLWGYTYDKCNISAGKKIVLRLNSYVSYGNIVCCCKIRYSASRGIYPNVDKNSTSIGELSMIPNNINLITSPGYYTETYEVAVNSNVSGYLWFGFYYSASVEMPAYAQNLIIYEIVIV